jgi:flagellin-like hook-associated protein FlgL
MTTIGSYGYSALASARADGTFRSLKSQLSDLQTQLASGQRATTYAGLGADAIKSLSGRSTLASIEAYASNVTDAQFRLKLMSTGIQQIAKIGNSLKVSLSDNYETTPIGQTTAIASATDGLKQVIDILNTTADDRSLFAGRASDVEPVEGYDLIVNGDANRAGLKQIIAERKAADLGTTGLGRMTVTPAANGVTVGEEAVPFGMKVAGASATGSGLVASTTTGSPASATLSVASQPAVNDTISLSLKLPDGSTTTLTFTAGADRATNPDGFAIGADATATAANLQAAVQSAITRVAGEKLPGASALGASQVFFAGSPSNPPQRVAGPPYDSATATVAGTAANTVIWYRGDDAAGSARETTPVRTGDATSVAIGARANEKGFRTVLAALGALVGQDFPAGSAEAKTRYAATTDAIADSIGDDMKNIVSEFGVASAGLAAAKSRLGIAKSQVEDAVAGVENADTSDVAMKLLATQTRLQASYQTTATITKLSLVNFL